MSNPKIVYHLELLEFLNEVGITQERNISDFIKIHFKKPTIRISNSDDKAVLFLQDLLKRGYIIYNIEALSHVNEWAKSTQPEPLEPRMWFDELEVNGSVTFGGLEYLTQQNLNKSIIESNRIISKNSTKQTNLIFITILLTLGNLLITVLNISLSDDKDKLLIRIQAQSKQIDTLQTKLLKAKIELLRAKGAKKTLPKKN